MSQQLQQTVRNPPPRMLTLTENLHSLNHWKTSFRTYYRRDAFFKAFLLPNATWNNSIVEHYGQTDDVNGTVITRTAADKGEDLKDFLNTLAGYLPFPYLTEKIVNGSRNMKNVWDTIYDHYGISVTSESLLNYVSIRLNDGESYRQFFDRLLAHARLHLPTANIVVDGVNTGPTGEAMTVGLMNFIAMDWLCKINPHLINIVQTEYSRELRDNVQLSDLVPRIANNIDAMLNRHDIVGGTGTLAISDEVQTVNRVKQSNFKTKNKFYKPSANTRRGRPFCPECSYLSKKLNLDVNFSHHPAECPRPRAAVNLLLAVQSALANATTDEEELDDTGKTKLHLINNNNESYQKSFHENTPESGPPDSQQRVEES